MHITIAAATKERILAYARQIAQYRGYPLLINGLQPIEDYEVAGKQYPGLRTKLAQEEQELREAWFNWQTGKGKTEWHVAHEAADCYYYSMQIEEQTGEHVWMKTYGRIRIYLPFHWNEREVETAALAKYGYRAEKPNNKDEAHELQLIQEAIQ
jgi:hypothetical protein